MSASMREQDAAFVGLSDEEYARRLQQNYDAMAAGAGDATPTPTPTPTPTTATTRRPTPANLGREGRQRSVDTRDAQQQGGGGRCGPQRQQDSPSRPSTLGDSLLARRMQLGELGLLNDSGADVGAGSSSSFDEQQQPARVSPDRPPRGSGASTSSAASGSGSGGGGGGRTTIRRQRSRSWNAEPGAVYVPGRNNGNGNGNGSGRRSRQPTTQHQQQRQQDQQHPQQPQQFQRARSDGSAGASGSSDGGDSGGGAAVGEHPGMRRGSSIDVSPLRGAGEGRFAGGGGGGGRSGGGKGKTSKKEAIGDMFRWMHKPKDKRQNLTRRGSDPVLPVSLRGMDEGAILGEGPPSSTSGNSSNNARGATPSTSTSSSTSPPPGPPGRTRQQHRRITTESNVPRMGDLWDNFVRSTGVAIPGAGGQAGDRRQGEDGDTGTSVTTNATDPSLDHIYVRSRPSPAVQSDDVAPAATTSTASSTPHAPGVSPSGQQPQYPSSTAQSSGPSGRQQQQQQRQRPGMGGGGGSRPSQQPPQTGTGGGSAPRRQQYPPQNTIAPQTAQQASPVGLNPWQQLYQSATIAYAGAHGPPICDACHRPAQSYLAALDKKYHRQCFRCMGCHELIDPSEPFTFSEENGVDGGGGDGHVSGSGTGERHPMHRTCYAELFGMKCTICRQTILPSQNGRISYMKHPFFDTDVMCPDHADVVRRCAGCHRFEPLYGTGFADLGDANRCVCYACCRTVIVDNNDAQPLWLRVLDFFETVLKLPVWEGMKEVPILIVGHETLNEQCARTAHGGSAQIMTRGLCLTEHSRVDNRRIGLMPRMRFDPNSHSFSKLDLVDAAASEPGAQHVSYFTVPDADTSNDRSAVTAILCLSGLPSDLTASILAHEATHAWLKLHPSYRYNKPIPPQVEEGCCQLVAHLFLNDGLDPPSTEVCAEDGGPSNERLRQYFKFAIETDVNEIYGEGFRKASKAYSEIGIELLLSHVVLYRAFPDL